MDCATVPDGNLDECLDLPGKQIEMSGFPSKVKTRFSFGVPTRILYTASDFYAYATHNKGENAMF